ncbi:MAG: sulfatase-like hydrolase/transferase [Planctomycetota bacterium]
MNNPPYDRREFMKAMGLGVAAWSSYPGLCPVKEKKGEAEKQPNILFLLADDLGWADVSYHRPTIRTPNIDKLAKGGVELHFHYVQPLCTPTRVSLLTGRYPSRWGREAIVPTDTQILPLGIETLPSALRKAGYDTCLAGKWHIGSTPEWGPNKYGFNESYGSLAGGVDPWTHQYREGPYSRTWHRNGTFVEEKGHATDLIAKQTLEWIETQSRPWFIYVPFTAVHIPVDAPKEFKDLYAGKQYFQNPEKNESYIRYAACITHMDARIGDMVKTLEQTGQLENTIIIFSSDNGTFPGTTKQEYIGNTPPSLVLGSNSPLRGRKSEAYEGAIRVPAAVSWAGHLEPRKITAPLHIVDWMPTLTQLAGFKPDQDLEWDGMDIWPLLTGAVMDPPARTIYIPGPYNSALRHGDWKLVQSTDGKCELYNLKEDPYEARDLATEMPERVTALKRRLTEAQKNDRKERPADRIQIKAQDPN